MFLRLTAFSVSLATVRNTRGVNGLVCFGGRPAIMPGGLVDELMCRKEYKQSLFNVGDRVSITAGPFAGLEGIFEQDDGAARVVILLEFMHKWQKLSMPLTEVCRVD